MISTIRTVGHLAATASGRTYAQDFFYLERTDWGNPPVSRSNTNEGSLDNKYIRLKLSTYDSGYDKAGNAKPGRYAWGTELQCTKTINPPAVGQAIDFEVRMRLPNWAPGMVASPYAIGQFTIDKQTSSSQPVAHTIVSDEIDFEYYGATSSSIGTTQGSLNSLLTTPWHAWERNYNQDYSIQYAPTYPYEDGVHHLGKYYFPQQSGVLLDPRQWHYLKFRWSRTSSGYVTQWYWKLNPNDTYQLLRTETGVQPSQAMQPHLNIWARNSGLTLATTPSANADYFMDVDFYKVTALQLDGSAASNTSALVSSGPVNAPPVGAPHAPASASASSSALGSNSSS